MTYRCLSIIIIAISFSVACGDGEDSGYLEGDNTLPGCAGKYTGSYKGSDSGNINAQLSDNGTLLVTFVSAAKDSGRFIEGVGSVSEDGDVTGSGQNVVISGEIDLDSCVLSGEWNALGGGKGTWKIGRISEE